MTVCNVLVLSSLHRHKILPECVESKLCGVRDNFAVGGRRNVVGRRLRTQEDSKERHVDEEPAMTLFLVATCNAMLELGTLQATKLTKL